VDDDGLCGGVYRTTDGGSSWEQQINLGSQNPNHIYMYNGSLGFICENNVYLRRTSNGCVNWDIISGAGGFLDMYFAGSLTGWKTSVQKTTDGGLTWVNQVLPQGGDIILSQINQFSFINSDTIWGVGGYVFWPGYGNRGMIYRTTNSGNNWQFQVPDTNISIGRYLYLSFIGGSTGWAYTSIPTGVHTTTGGDPVWYTGIQQVSSKTPVQFKLYQNYPNPFNPKTNIKYQIVKRSYVKLAVFDITGREIITLVDRIQTGGTYEVDFSGNGLSSGVYFYRIQINSGKEVFTDTRKMILIK
jgi:hypothetical protein